MPEVLPVGSNSASARRYGRPACPLFVDPAITVEEAARRLKVAPSTLCRHLPAGAGRSWTGDRHEHRRRLGKRDPAKNIAPSSAITPS
ncbi:MAG: hypothetical protein LC776_04585 [Acidobacteria bacterium]|nr:hypothetical protein [Acidobacteriota bacterium]